MPGALGDLHSEEGGAEPKKFDIKELREKLDGLEEGLFKIVAFLGTCGYGLTSLTDFEDGLPLDQLLALNVEAGRISLAQNKMQVNGMCVALGSMFDQKVLQTFNREIDAALAETELPSAQDPEPVASKASKGTPSPPENAAEIARKSAQARQSVAELNKLNKLLGGF